MQLEVVDILRPSTYSCSMLAMVLVLWIILWPHALKCQANNSNKYFGFLIQQAINNARRDYNKKGIFKWHISWEGLGNLITHQLLPLEVIAFYEFLWKIFHLRQPLTIHSLVPQLRTFLHLREPIKINAFF